MPPPGLNPKPVMTLRDLLRNPPPGPLADYADWLIAFGDRNGWDTPRTAEVASPTPLVPSRRRLGSVTEAAEELGLPERTVRAHAREAERKAYPPFYCDREGPSGSYRIDLDEYAGWRRALQGKQGGATPEGEAVVSEIVAGLLETS